MKTETKLKAEAKKPEAVKQKPKVSDPYDNRVISPAIPKCVVTGDPLDNPVQFIYEGDEEHGTLENSL